MTEDEICFFLYLFLNISIYIPYFFIWNACSLPLPLIGVWNSHLSSPLFTGVLVLPTLKDRVHMKACALPLSYTCYQDRVQSALYSNPNLCLSVFLYRAGSYLCPNSIRNKNKNKNNLEYVLTTKFHFVVRV